jgi:hypothetical protein
MQIVETAEPSFEICKIVDFKSCFSKNTVLNLQFSNFKELIKVARSRGLVVRAEDSRTYNQEDVGSIPDTVYWMDVSVASYYIERKLIKVAKWGTPKNF